jgi:hypothetical protein
MNGNEPTTDRPWLDPLRDQALAEADLRLTPRRLTAQREQIARRLAALERSAEIIAFPGSHPGTRHLPSRSHKWVAAAAVVGLMTGVLAGRFLHLHPDEFALTGGTALETAPAMIVENIGTPVVAAYSEEAILVDIDTSLYTPRIAELRALDALTPTVREAMLAH